MTAGPGKYRNEQKAKKKKREKKGMDREKKKQTGH